MGTVVREAPRHSALLRTLLLVSISAVLLSTGSAQGGSIPDSGWWMTLYLQNAGSNAATINAVAIRMLTPGPSPTPPNPPAPTQTPQPRPMEAYHAALPPFTPVPTGVAITLLPRDFKGLIDGQLTEWPSSFVGSVLVNATQPVSLVLELTNRPSAPYGVTNGKAVARYEGTYHAARSTTLYFPTAKHRASADKSSTLFIQNIGTVEGVIDFGFVCGEGVIEYQTPIVRPGEMIAVSPAECGVDVGDVCAATVTADFLMVGMYAEHYDSESPATLLQTSRALTALDSGTVLYAPVFKEQFPTHTTQSRTTGLTVMNASASTTTDITATFHGCTGGPYSKEIEGVGPGDVAIFLHPTDVGVPTGCLGTAVITSDPSVSMVGWEHEAFLNPVPAAGTQSATVSPLLPASAAATTIFMPVYKETYGNRTSGITVMNISASSTATVTLVFQTAGSTYTINNQQIAPNGNYAWSLLAGLSSGVYSVTAHSNYPIVANVSEATYFADNDPPYYCFGSSSTCYDRSNYVGFK